MSAHEHQPRFVIGQYPVAATCRTCPMVKLANGGGWVTEAEAAKRRRGIGWRAAL